LHCWSSKNWIQIRIGIQQKMLDPESMNPDLSHLHRPGLNDNSRLFSEGSKIPVCSVVDPDPVGLGTFLSGRILAQFRMIFPDPVTNTNRTVYAIFTSK
jgi:hypothetical protein